MKLAVILRRIRAEQIRQQQRQREQPDLQPQQRQPGKDRQQAEELARKLRRSEFSLEDYRDQLRQVFKMGPLDQVLSMIPGLGGQVKDVDTAAGEREMRRAVAIIDSMTPGERRDHALINGSRRKRIARGSGTSVEDVNRLLKQFVQMKKMLKVMGGGTTGKMYKRMGQLRSLMR